MSLRTTLRGWARQPSWTLSVLACLALSIAGAGTVMTFAYSLLVRPLPFPQPERLALLVPKELGPGARAYLSHPNFNDLRERLTSFETLDGAMVARLVVETPLGSERLRGEAVTPRYFELLGVAPARGRAFTAEEYAGRGEPVVLLSHRFWQSHLAGDGDVVGRELRTRAGVRTVIGVMPEGFPGLAESDGTDVWLPERQTSHQPMLSDRVQPTVMVFGRLRADASLAQASAELAAAEETLKGEHAEANRSLALAVQPLADYWRERFQGVVRWLALSALFLLVIGAGNVALLMLVRTLSAERELALRQALGASPRRMLSEQWRQGALLALLGGALGVTLAVPMVRWFAEAGRFAIPIHLQVQLDTTPLLWCALAVVLVASLVALVPGLAAREGRGTLNQGGRGVLGHVQGRRLRALLVGAQCALSFAVLVGAALFGQSYERLRHIDFGFRTEQLLRYQVSLQVDQYREQGALQSFWDELGRNLSGVPGVQAHGYMSPTLPPYDAEETNLSLVGAQLANASGALPSNLRYATPEAFDVLGIGLRAGRGFEAGDRAGTQPVALVSESLARTLGGDVLNRTIRLALATPVDAQIVGVLADARWNGQRNRAPNGNDVFLSLAQFPQPSVGIVLDVAGSTSAAVQPVRERVLRQDPAAAMHWIDTMDEALDAQTAPERFFALLGWGYGAAALLLSMFGLYGVVSYFVTSRQRELGLRLALGATPMGLHGLIQAQALRPALVGVGLGAGLGIALGRLVENQLYGVQALDPASYAFAGAAVLGGALVAALLPGVRAALTSPLASLGSP